MEELIIVFCFVAIIAMICLAIIIHVILCDRQRRSKIKSDIKSKKEDLHDWRL